MENVSKLRNKIEAEAAEKFREGELGIFLWRKTEKNNIRAKWISAG